MQLMRALSIGFATVVGVVACNSGTSSFGFGGGTISAGGGVVESTPPSKGPGPPIFAECPVAQPGTGGSCSAVTCEYGTSPDPACNTIAHCTADYVWEITEPTHCPTSCPEQFDDRVPGEACSDPDVCTYFEATCGCAGAIVPWQTADAGDPDAADGSATPDGGSAEAGTPLAGHWQCVRPGNGCPARRPALGSRCKKESLTCDYGTSVFGVPLTYLCASGTWIDASEYP